VLQERLGAQVELVKGSGGVFNVDVDGTRIFSKHQEGRFPEPEEILQRLAAKAP
jgi:selT/selW/selH-like putative selenoprotein